MADTSAAVGDDDGYATAAEPMVAVYRHDVHKLRLRQHARADDEYHGVPVNETVPHGADADAALLSRPPGDPEQTVSNHSSRYRLSLLTGESAIEPRRIKAAADGGFHELIVPDDPARLHATWLTSDVAPAFNESVYYPFTSLKYHVLLTAALLSAYRDGRRFDELYLTAYPGEPAAADATDVEPLASDDAALASDVVSPHETVLWSPFVTLAVTSDPGDRPAAPLDAGPARSFADVWSRLSGQPFASDETRAVMMLDAQLRRLRSWSAALQYIEDFGDWYDGYRDGAANPERGCQ